MNIFFDVDYTLIDWDGSLRPHVREVFERLVSEGHQIYIWSGVGLRWEVIHQHSLGDLVSGCYLKPMSNHRQEMERLGVPVEPDFVIDDHSAVVSAFGGYIIRPYYSYGGSQDTEMLRVYDAIARYAANNGSGTAPPDLP